MTTATTTLSTEICVESVCRQIYAGATTTTCTWQFMFLSCVWWWSVHSTTFRWMRCEDNSHRGEWRYRTRIDKDRMAIKFATQQTHQNGIPTRQHQPTTKRKNKIQHRLIDDALPATWKSFLFVRSRLSACVFYILWHAVSLPLYSRQRASHSRDLLQYCRNDSRLCADEKWKSENNELTHCMSSAHLSACY